MYEVPAVGALLALASDFAVAKCAQANGKPPLSFARIGGEISVGLGGALVGVILPCILLSSGTDEDWGGMFAMFFIVPVASQMGEYKIRPYEI